MSIEQSDEHLGVSWSAHCRDPNPWVSPQCLSPDR